MPARSRRQYRYMKAAEAGKVRKKGAPSKAVAKEFTDATKSYKALPEKAPAKRKRRKR